MDRQYENYARSRLEGGHGEMSSWRFVYPYLKGKKVLDVGCSDGLYLKYLTADSRGIEQVPELAEAAVVKGLDVIAGDVQRAVTQMENDSFEGVLFSHTMEHVDAPIIMLREIQRVLKPGGTLVLGLPIERNIFRDLLRMDYYEGTHIYSFSVKNARKLMGLAGFSIEKVYFHLPRCRGPVGRVLETIWNVTGWPFREYFSMAYWIIGTKI